MGRYSVTPANLTKTAKSSGAYLRVHFKVQFWFLVLLLLPFFFFFVIGFHYLHLIEEAGKLTRRKLLRLEHSRDRWRHSRDDREEGPRLPGGRQVAEALHFPSLA